ncbi:MAG: hypothetical protein HY270_04980 [Deltaproteobacteria bacterium]|nr:hypothetical protein [Deltaproteobacteria bacterium]
MATSSRVLSIAITTVALILFLRGPAQQPATPDAVRAVFRSYKEAVLKGDGRAAAATLSQRTVDWYRESQELALHGTKTAVQQLEPLKRFQVLAFRYRMEPELLRKMSPSEVIGYAVEQGWMSKAALERTDIGQIKISGDRAEGTITLDGKPSDQQYDFVREQGEWRFDQIPLLASGNAQISAAAAQRQMTEDQLILALIEAFSHKKVGDDIWNPPGDAAK